jgi:hypothetical protein
MSTIYSVGMMNQLADSLAKAGFTPDDVTKLRSYKELGLIRDLLRGKARIEVVHNPQITGHAITPFASHAKIYTIDCGSVPYIPENWEITDHKPAGQLVWDPARTWFYLSAGQRTCGNIKGTQLRSKVKRENTLNACVLDHLLAHQNLIPTEWKGHRVYFWATIYNHPQDKLVVRFLFNKEGDKWDSSHSSLDSEWGGNDPAVCWK